MAKKKVFEVGKYYKHEGEKAITYLSIISEAKTTIHGDCLIAEDQLGRLLPVGKEEENAENFVEIKQDEWEALFD